MNKTRVHKKESLGVKIERALSKIKALTKKEFGVLILVQILMFTAIYAVNNFHPYFEELHFVRMQTLSGRILIFSLLTILVFQISFLLYIAYLFFKYKAIPSVTDEELPSCTIIVPAYNEGKLVYETLLSIAASDFPMHKMEVIAVDDGSKDDTWYWINKANADLENTITVYKQPVNKGKRHALHIGFTTGTGDVFISIDSDSVVEKNTITNLISPFAVNKNCGAVAGNVKVLNKNQGMIPRMLNVSFVFSFEFMRAAQSSLGFVLCTPGALSAYRREAVLHSLKDWIDQKFLGRAATIGEDRAMTNLILKQGYDVQFQRNANVLTNTPTSFKTLHKMFTRWGRSNVRETLMMNRFVFSDFRKKNKTGARFIFINQWVNLIAAFPLMILMFYFLMTHPLLYLSSALTATFIFASIQMLFFSRKYNFVDALWAYPYSVFYLFGLFWIFPFSIATVKNGGWLTR
ncbi:glycosyltransferase family 2 protein [Chryseobacterium sp. SNU WT5]|uniref:glycosyltransferase n=1 Tax=Chryseobacterium sp. SNU WT5 TaxID=2594269 RepID=UPI00117CB13D|nr:glycosyltransferase [Chryseobacterium sp. SNU WT5]QDP86493.1 glycosyltransferase family 2 protein [Chryseobacterium sp. SNU WT5]